MHRSEGAECARRYERFEPPCPVLEGFAGHVDGRAFGGEIDLPLHGPGPIHVKLAHEAERLLDVLPVFALVTSQWHPIGSHTSAAAASTRANAATSDLLIKTTVGTSPQTLRTASYHSVSRYTVSNRVPSATRSKAPRLLKNASFRSSRKPGSPMMSQTVAPTVIGTPG